MNNNKQYILILVALLVLGGLGFYFVSGATDEESPSITDNLVEKKMDNSLDSKDTVVPKKEESMKKVILKKEAPESTLMYDFTDGSVTYTVQKEWLKKPVQTVSGTTKDVSGAGWLDPETGALYLEANVDLLSLSTGNSDRDTNVQGRWAVPSAQLVLDLDSSSIKPNEEFELELPATLTINGVTNDVTVGISGTVGDEELTANGTVDILMTDYSFDPPTVAGLFSVDDEVNLEFDVTGMLAK